MPVRPPRRGVRRAAVVSDDENPHRVGAGPLVLAVLELNWRGSGSRAGLSLLLLASMCRSHYSDRVKSPGRGHATPS